MDKNIIDKLIKYGLITNIGIDADKYENVDELINKGIITIPGAKQKILELISEESELEVEPTTVIELEKKPEAKPIATIIEPEKGPETEPTTTIIESEPIATVIEPALVATVIEPEEKSEEESTPKRKKQAKVTE